MKLDTGQKIIVAVIALLFLTFVGSLVFINDESETVVTVPALDTSTPASDLTSSGWWVSIPTDPALPTMPVPVLTVTATMTSSP